MVCLRNDYHVRNVLRQTIHKYRTNVSLFCNYNQTEGDSTGNVAGQNLPLCELFFVEDLAISKYEFSVALFASF